MLIAIRGVEFSFSNQMYTQLDGVAMGSPLGKASKGRVAAKELSDVDISIGIECGIIEINLRRKKC